MFYIGIVLDVFGVVVIGCLVEGQEEREWWGEVDDLDD